MLPSALLRGCLAVALCALLFSCARYRLDLRNVPHPIVLGPSPFAPGQAPNPVGTKLGKYESKACEGGALKILLVIPQAAFKSEDTTRQDAIAALEGKPARAITDVRISAGATGFILVLGVAELAMSAKQIGLEGEVMEYGPAEAPRPGAGAPK